MDRKFKLFTLGVFLGVVSTAIIAVLVSLI
jgi:hypothetical protein